MVFMKNLFNLSFLFIFPLISNSFAMGSSSEESYGALDLDEPIEIEVKLLEESYGVLELDEPMEIKVKFTNEKPPLTPSKGFKELPNAVKSANLKGSLEPFARKKSPSESDVPRAEDLSLPITNTPIKRERSKSYDGGESVDTPRAKGTPYTRPKEKVSVFKKQGSWFHRPKSSDVYKEKFFTPKSILSTYNYQKRRIHYEEKLNELMARETLEAKKGFLRQTDNLREIWTYFRIITKPYISSQLEMIRHMDLAFLNDNEIVSKLVSYCGQQYDDEGLAKKLRKFATADEGVKSKQKQYTDFLMTLILPMLQHAPLEVMLFFNQLATIVEPHFDEKSPYNAEDFALTHYMLYVIVPLITDIRTDSIGYSHEELKDFERKEKARLARDEDFNKLTKEEQKTELLEAVCAQMNRFKQDKIDRTYGNDDQKRIQDSRLSVLLTISFNEPNEIKLKERNAYLGVLSSMITGKLDTDYFIIKTHLRDVFFDAVRVKKAL